MKLNNRTGLIATLAALGVLLAVSALFLPALAQTEDEFQQTVDAVVNEYFTQTAAAAVTATPNPATQTAQFDAAVQAAFDAALTATANAANPGQAQATAEPVQAVDAAEGAITLANATQIGVALELQAHDGPVYGVSFSADGRLLASAGEDGTVRVWNTALGAQERVLQHDTGVNGVVVSADGTFVASADFDGNVYLWDVTTGEQRVQFAGHGDASEGALPVAFAPDGSTFSTFSFGNNELITWDATTGEAVATEGPTFFAQPFYLADGRELLALADPADDSIILLREGDTVLMSVEDIEPVDLSPTGDRLTTVGDGIVRVWAVPSGDLVAEIGAFGFGLMRFNVDGTLLAEGGEDGTLHLFDAATGQQVALYSGHEGFINEAVFSPDGSQIATVGDDGIVRVWRVGAEQPEQVVAADDDDDSNDDAEREGFPPVTEAEVQVAEQVFEGGRMFWVQPVNQIWVLETTGEGQGTWTVYEDTYSEGEPATDPNIEAPEGLIQPERGFGKLWRENPTVRDILGWAVTPEFGFVSTYRYIPGGEVVDGEYAPGPGFHVLFSLNSEEFRFDESNGRWQLGGEDED